MPQASPVISGFDADRVSLPDGRAALVLSYDQIADPTGTTGLLCDVHALRTVIGTNPSDVIVFWPHGSDRTALLQAATRCGPTVPVLGTAAPVTDAVKRVVGAHVVDTVDRSRLAWIVGPAVVDAAVVRRRIQSASGHTVRPLTGSVSEADTETAPGIIWL